MTDRQFPWDVLGIDETDDKKLIKKAYAVLIKQYKPDEQPEKFKEIHEAYKYALLLIYSIDEQIILSYNREDSIVIDTTDSELTNSEKEVIDTLLKKLKEMTFSKLRDKNDLVNWAFLEKFYELENLNLKDKIAKIVFKNVAENNLFLMKGYNRLLVNPKVLKYMNTIFDWTSKWQEYGQSLPGEYFIVTLDYIESTKGLCYFVLVEDIVDGINYSIDKKAQQMLEIIEVPIKRFWSLIIELFIPIVILVPLNFYEIVSNNFSSFYFLIFIGIRLGLEMLTNNHSSIGKKILRIKSVDDYGNSSTNKQVLIRNLILYISLAPLIYYLLNNSLYGIILFGIINAFNLIVLFYDNRLLHDFVSKTRIVKN